MTTSISLRDLDRWLGSLAADYPPQVLHAMSEIPGLQAAVDLIHRARAYRAVRWQWASARTEERRTQLQAELDAWEADLEATCRDIHSRCERLGVKPAGTGLPALQAAWPELSERVRQHVQDEELLGPGRDKEYEEQLVGEGMVRKTAPTVDPFLASARRVRDDLGQAAGLASQVERLGRRVEAVDVHEVDELHAAVVQQLRAEGMVPKPGMPDAFPEMPADLAAGLVTLGFTTG